MTGGPAGGLTGAELAGVAALLGSGPLTGEPIPGGRSNLTVRLDDGDRTWVLRTPPRAGRTPSAHDVAREHRITAALAGTDVPVARPVLLVEDEDLLGGPFAVWEHVPGTTVQSAADLDALDDATVAATVDALVATLAALHRVDHEAVGLGTLARADGYAARQLRRWTGQWGIVATGDHALRADVDRLATRLGEAVDALPPQRSTGIVHGDYRIDNTLLDLPPVLGAPRVLAVVDWELCTLGDPVADVALMTTYRDPALDLVLGSPTAWTSDRLPDAAALAAAYEAAGGVPLDHLEVHLALAHLKLAVIAAGIEHRRRAGAASGPGFDTAGQAVGPLVSRGLRLLG